MINSNKKISGVTLIELMIALTLGLLVLVIIVNIFISQKGSYTLQENMARVQENGRFVLDYLSRDLRMAGRPDASQTPTQDHPLPFPEYHAINNDIPRSNADNSQSGANVTDTTATKGDRLSISYFPIEGGNQEDCLGNKLDSAATPRLDIDNTYFINADTEQLFCLGIDKDDSADTLTDADTKDAIADGISDMQIQYGIDSNGDGAANIYTAANNVSNWNEVISVRLSLLVASPNATPAYKDDQKYKLLDAPTISASSFNDRKLRRTFTTTVMIRNLQAVVQK